MSINKALPRPGSGRDEITNSVMSSRLNELIDWAQSRSLPDDEIGEAFARVIIRRRTGVHSMARVANAWAWRTAETQQAEEAPSQTSVPPEPRAGACGDQAQVSGPRREPSSTQGETAPSQASPAPEAQGRTPNRGAGLLERTQRCRAADSGQSRDTLGSGPSSRVPGLISREASPSRNSRRTPAPPRIADQEVPHTSVHTSRTTGDRSESSHDHTTRQEK